jgi:lipopolysaccharide/colanic/teichoic acid biosynthesis glycosyltransferase
MRAYLPFKRAIDLVGACAALIVLCPVVLLVAVLVRVKLGSPVLFSQERTGRGSQSFRLYKFRSMTQTTGPDGKLLPDDQRLTKFGRALRASSVDELPELWNVIRGDMSLVGPRPLPVKYQPRYSSAQARRHEVRPGLTGLAQVNGRNTTDWRTRFAFDIEYVNTFSFRSDVSILLRTVTLVVRREGISQEGHATMTEFLGEQ